jgi:DNA-binding MarR family transcriptional regulator
MKIEKEIYQDKFASEKHKATVNLLFTSNWLNTKIRDELAPYDITTQQFNILRILRGQQAGPATVNLLKERMLDKMCDASRMVERLKDKGLIEKRINKSDRRAADIFISKKGMELLAEIDKARNPEQIMPNLTDKEAEMLNFLLDKMRG